MLTNNSVADPPPPVTNTLETQPSPATPTPSTTQTPQASPQSIDNQLGLQSTQSTGNTVDWSHGFWQRTFTALWLPLLLIAFIVVIIIYRKRSKHTAHPLDKNQSNDTSKR